MQPPDPDANPDAATTRVDPSPWGALLVSHLAATVLVILEFVMLQAVAVGITTGVYSLIPVLDTAAESSFGNWLRVFQIVNPTITISGGAAIVLSSIIFARRSQLDNAARLEAEQQARRFQEQIRDYQEQARESAAQLQAARAELAIVTERLARLENGDAPTAR
jgi:hypothetical protein